MRGVMSYILAGIVVVLAMDVVAPGSLGVAVFAWPVANEKAPVQIVNRAHKSDRLQVPTASGHRMTPPMGQGVPVGCESVFSPLSAHARANFPGRCMAERTVPTTANG